MRPASVLLTLALLLASALVAGCATSNGACGGAAGAGGPGASGGATGNAGNAGATTGPAPMAAAASGAGGGQAYASGGCGPCQGSAVAGNGYASVSGGCGPCSGQASADGAGAMSSAGGSCAGCSGDAMASGSSADASASGSCVGATKDVQAYTFTGTVTGANPASPDGDGPLAPTPSAKDDAFTLANGTVGLMFKSEFAGGGSGRIEVYGPSGAIVYRSYDYYCVGAPGTAACTQQGTETSSDEVTPGTYTIHYLVAGAADISFDVVATVLV